MRRALYFALVSFVAFAAAACGELDDAVEPNERTDERTDARFFDAGSASDANTATNNSGGDASFADASVADAGTTDGGSSVDMSVETCTANGRDGVCLPTAECGEGFQSIPGFCPGPTDIQCCVQRQVDGACAEDPGVDDMPRPNAGRSEAPGEGGCPAGMTSVNGFCIDRWEAALVEVRADGSERHWSPYFNPGQRRVRAVSIEGAIPQAYISGDQARAACAEAGKRLCSNAEWLRACQGAEGRIYPYGDTRQPGVCNDARVSHPVVDYFESTDDSIWSQLDNACIGQQPDTVDAAGSNPGCVSPDGAFDLMGNLHEWTTDRSGTFRGGFYADTTRNGPGCLYATTAHTTPHWDYSTGFRCCADL